MQIAEAFRCQPASYSLSRPSPRDGGPAPLAGVQHSCRLGAGLGSCAPKAVYEPVSIILVDKRNGLRAPTRKCWTQQEWGPNSLLPITPLQWGNRGERRAPHPVLQWGHWEDTGHPPASCSVDSRGGASWASQPHGPRVSLWQLFPFPWPRSRSTRFAW